MTIRAADVVAPVFATTEVVVFFLSRMTAEAGLRGFFRRFRFERNNLLRVALFEVSLAWSMTGFATGYSSFPATAGRQPCMGGMCESFELVLVAILTSLAADVVIRFEESQLDFAERRRLRGVVATKPDGCREYKPTDQECFAEPVHLGPPGLPIFLKLTLSSNGRYYSRFFVVPVAVTTVT